MPIYSRSATDMGRHVAEGMARSHHAPTAPTKCKLCTALPRPLLTQVSRFGPRKDRLGVIDAYRMVKADIPDVQLALIGSMASDDPEGWFYLDKTCRHAVEDFDIRLLHNDHGVGGLEVGTFQAASDVVIQKSVREGFGLTVAEGLCPAQDDLTGLRKTTCDLHTTCTGARHRAGLPGRLRSSR